MALKTLDVSSSRLALIFMIAMLPCVLGALAYLTGEVDAHVKVDEQQLVSYSVTGWVHDVESKVVGQADWDDAMLHLGKQFDAKWAHAFVGEFLFDVGGLAESYVIDGRDAPLYASQNGQDLPPAAFAALAPSITTLVAQVRGVERALHGRKDYGQVLAKPIHVSSFKTVAGKPVLVTGTLVQSDYGHVKLAGPAPIIITVATMDAAFIHRLTEQLMLKHLQIAAGTLRQADAARADVPLTESDGRTVGTIFWAPHRPGRELFLALASPILAALAAFIAVAVFLDIRARRAARELMLSEQRATYLAFHDNLTDLPNRAMFNDLSAQASLALRNHGSVCGVLAIDLDHFKQINDSFGHGAGDELIVAVAARLSRIAAPGDVVARIGGDEFAVLCSDASAETLERKAEALLEYLSRPYDLVVGQLLTGCSIGGALIKDPRAAAGEVLRQADVALYCAKAAGRGRYLVFDPVMDSERQMRRGIEADLRKAIADRTLDVAYQLQVDTQGRPLGLEALVRWHHPERGHVSPALFVGIAEECGLIGALGEFVMERAFADACHWPTLKVAINISPIELRTPGFCDRVRTVLARTGADPGQMELEITEGILLDKENHTVAALQRLRKMGCSIAIDDFGTGYSSLSYLRQYPVDKIKIDRAFVTSLGLDARSEQVIGAIVSLARALDLDVIAEGVETRLQLDILTRAGCRHFQGYLFHRPQRVDEIIRLLAATSEIAAAC